jgi:hypothetical protein
VSANANASKETTMKTVLGMWLVALVVAMVGCTEQVQEPGGPLVGGPGERMTRETPEEEEEMREEVATTATLVVRNDSSATVFYLYVSPSVESSWGPDQLGSSNVIDPGESFQVNGIPCGQNYDLMATDAYDEPMATSFGNFFACGDTLTWRLY